MDNTYPHSRTQARAVPARDVPRSVAIASDAELVMVSVRDPDAFTELFERHWDALYRFCLNRAGSVGEDITAEAFRAAFDRHERHYAQYSDARPWLFGIATK